MAFGDDLNSEVVKILRERWTTRNGRVVPNSEDLKLGNDVDTLEGTVLYADLDDSTTLVDTMKPLFAAEIYKCFLACADRIVRSEGGEITSYDGDRIMAVFIGDAKESVAARTALKINFAVQEIISPAIRNQYPITHYLPKARRRYRYEQSVYSTHRHPGSRRSCMGGPRGQLRGQALCSERTSYTDHHRSVRDAQRQFEDWIGRTKYVDPCNSHGTGVQENIHLFLALENIGFCIRIVDRQREWNTIGAGLLGRISSGYKSRTNLNIKVLDFVQLGGLGGRVMLVVPWEVVKKREAIRLPYRMS